MSRILCVWFSLSCVILVFSLVVAVLTALVALFSVVKLTPSALCSLNRRRMRVNLPGPALHLEIPVGARAATMAPA
jgi:hypothetical protein